MRSAAGRLAVLAALAVFGLPAAARAGCGCDKPPPPRAVVRPFVGHTDTMLTVFDDRLEPGRRYNVLFEATADGSADWSRGKTVLARDLADGELRPQLRVRLGAVGLGPCRISVWDDGDAPVLVVDDDQLTVAARPIALYDFAASFTRGGYRAGVGRDGTIYIPVDVGQATDAATFRAVASGLPLRFEAADVAIYNDQGLLMELLDAREWAHYGVTPSPVVVAGNAEAADGAAPVPPDTSGTSSVLTYWRHEFATYKHQHRADDGVDTDDDPNWHNNGTAHVDHDHLVVAIRGTLSDGSTPAAGATPVFDLIITSLPDGPPDTAPPVEEGESTVAADPVDERDTLAPAPEPERRPNRRGRRRARRG